MVAYLDHIFVIGLFLLGMTFFSAVQSFSRGNPPRSALISLFLGGCLIIYAHMSRPGGYTVAELPDVVVRVFTGV